MKLPDKFEIRVKWNPLDRFTITKGAGNKHYYARKIARSLDDAYDSPMNHSVEFVEAAVKNGDWIITKDLTEPELVLPFTATHGDLVYRHDDQPESLFVVSEGSKAGYVKVVWRNGAVSDNVWALHDVRAFIKNGVWIVKHVGEKAPEVVTNTTYLSAADMDKISINCDNPDAKIISVGSAEAATSYDRNHLKLSVEFDAKDALEAVNDLTEKIRSLTNAVKELKEVLKW